MEFDTDEGEMAVIMVGAMIVAAIQPVWRSKPYQARLAQEEIFSPPRHFNQGDELGEFQMGSTAIVITAKSVDWRQASSANVQMGQTIVA